MNATQEEKRLTFFDNIEKFMPYGQYALAKDYGMTAFKEFLSDVEMFTIGMSAEDIGVKERKAAQLPKLIQYENGRGSIIQDPEALKDPKATPKGSFAHLKLSGVMRTEGGWCSRGVNALVDDVQNAYGNPNVAGILLEVRSGGGEALAGQILKSALTDAPIPIVGLVHYSGSAAVMATLPITEIIASDKMAQIGSVGTYTTVDKTISKWYKQWYTDIYAKKSTNKNKAWRDMQEGNLDTLQNEIDTFNEYFLDAVSEFRQLAGSKTQIDHTLSGAMFFADEAKQRGLIDGVGNFQYALARLDSYARK